MMTRYYPLVCGHTIGFKVSPRKFDVVFCAHCGDYREYDVKLWTAQCQDCSYLRHFPNAPVTADTKAAVHSIHNLHRVHLYYNRRFVRALGPDDTTAQLSLFDHSQTAPD